MAYFSDHKRGRGRPRKNPDDVLPGKCDVRLSADEMDKLEQMVDETGSTKSDVMRKALNYLFRYVHNK